MAPRGTRGKSPLKELTVSSEQGNGRALRTRTTRPADAVDVVLRVVGVVIVEHMRDVAHILKGNG